MTWNRIIRVGWIWVQPVIPSVVLCVSYFLSMSCACNAEGHEKASLPAGTQQARLSDASPSFRTPLGSVNEVASECLLENTDLCLGTAARGLYERGTFVYHSSLISVLNESKNSHWDSPNLSVYFKSLLSQFNQIKVVKLTDVVVIAVDRIFF